VTALGRAVRSDLGELLTLSAVRAAAHSSAPTKDPAVLTLRRATALRAEALAALPPEQAS
jgi:hypothetical protein